MKCPMTGFDCVTCEDDCTLMRDKGRGAPVADGGPAFPASMLVEGMVAYQPGMSLRDWFMGQALSNPAICTGTAPEWKLAEWFGTEIAITKGRIIARQASDAADAMLKARQS